MKEIILRWIYQNLYMVSFYGIECNGLVKFVIKLDESVKGYESWSV